MSLKKRLINRFGESAVLAADSRFSELSANYVNDIDAHLSISQLSLSTDELDLDQNLHIKECGYCAELHTALAPRQEISIGEAYKQISFHGECESLGSIMREVGHLASEKLGVEKIDSNSPADRKVLVRLIQEGGIPDPRLLSQATCLKSQSASYLLFSGVLATTSNRSLAARARKLFHCGVNEIMETYLPLELKGHPQGWPAITLEMTEAEQSGAKLRDYIGATFSPALSATQVLVDSPKSALSK